MNTSHTLVTKTARAFLALVLVALPLVFTTATIEGFEDAKGAALSLSAIAFIALGVVAFLSAKVRPTTALRQPLVVGVSLCVLSAVVSTLLSVSPRTSWRGAYESHAGLMTILGYAVLFFAARQLGGGRRLLVGVVLAAAVTSGYALVQAAHHDPVVWEGTNYFGTQLRPFGTLGHANHLGAYLAMALPVIAYLTLHWAQGRRWVLVAGISVVAGAVCLALILTFSRAAWLATTCALLVLLIGWCCARAWKAAATLLVLVFLLEGTGWLAYERQWLPEAMQAALNQRLRKLDDGNGRRDLWLAAWQIYGDHPLTGSGLDTFRYAFGTKRTAAFWDKEGDATPTKAHNEALHILATQGSLGGAALLALLAGLNWAIIKIWRRTNDRPLLVAVVASMVAFGVTNLFGFTVIGTGALFIVLAGLLSRWAAPVLPAVGADTPSSHWRWATPGIILAAVVVSYLGVIEPLLANLSCRRGDLDLVEAPTKAVASYRRAIELDPESDLYCLRLADASHREALRTGSPEEVQRTRQALEQAVALVPADAYHHANLGRFLGELARTDHSVNDAAIAAWREAVALDPHNPYILAEASRTGLVVGDFEVARDYAARGAALYPSWAIFPAQIGAAALGRGDYSEAAAGLGKSLDLDWHNDAEGYGRTLAMLASAELRLQDFNKAQEFAGKAAVWLPLWPTPHLMRAQALQALGQRDASIKEILTARKLQGLPTGPVTSSASPHSAPTDTSTSQCAE